MTNRAAFNPDANRAQPQLLRIGQKNYLGAHVYNQEEREFVNNMFNIQQKGFIGERALAGVLKMVVGMRRRS